MKVCPRCGIDKPAHNYSLDSSRSDKLQRLCKTCDSKKARAYYKANRTKKQTYYRLIKNTKRYKRIRHKYNLTDEAYDAMIIEQDGNCVICGHKDNRPLSIDHDHLCCPGNYSCGKCIRGLLCNRCNMGLGAFDDDINVILNALEYLMKYRDKQISRV